MKILSIDLGSHSVKFLSSQLDRRGLTIEKSDKVYLELPSNATTLDIEEKHLAIVQKYLQDNPFDGKKILQIPSKWLTSRFLTFPVSSKKKAEQMLPFQLDRELPFNLSNIQFASQFIAQRSSYFTLSSIIDLNRFDSFFKKLEFLNLLPDIMTSEASLYQSYIHQRKFDVPFCILDIGYETTKAFFVQDKKIISTHLCHIAGKAITEFIAKTYQISLDEAENFKITKGFCLTESQYQDVDNDQKEFGLMMDKILSPLIFDIKRWELGHRISYGENIKNVYVCGGSSHLKNLTNYMTQKLSLNVSYFDYLVDSSIKNSALKADEYSLFQIPFLMAQTIESKLPPINLRKGPYSSGDQTEIPFYSAFFIGVRVLALSFIIFTALLFERVFLLKQEKSIETQITKLIKRSELGIPKRDQRLYQMKPEMILSKLKIKYKEIENEIELMQTISKTNAINPLISINNTLKNKGRWFIKRYENVNNFVVIEIDAEDEETYKNIKGQLSFLPYSELNFQDDPQFKNLYLEFKDSVL